MTMDRIVVKAKSRKYAKYAKIMTQVLNSPQIKAQIDKEVQEELAREMLKPRVVGLGWFKRSVESG